MSIDHAICVKKNCSHWCFQLASFLFTKSQLHLKLDNFFNLNCSIRLRRAISWAVCGIQTFKGCGALLCHPIAYLLDLLLLKYSIISCNSNISWWRYSPADYQHIQFLSAHHAERMDTPFQFHTMLKERTLPFSFTPCWKNGHSLSHHAERTDTPFQFTHRATPWP